MSDASESQPTLGDIPDLTPEDRALIADAILRFGTGEHPLPEGDQLDFFRVSYARECLARAKGAGEGDAGALTALEERLLAAVT